MISHLRVLSLAILSLCVQSICVADDPIFSGPQVGEKFPPFKAKGVFGELAGKEFDLIKQAEKKSVALVFFHARTRPAFGLTNTIMKFAATRSKAGLESGVIFLTDDPTATEAWMHQVEKYFPKGIFYGLSTDGVEGPGAYGLNRNVTLTILIGKEGKVTANYALVQPGIQADGPKILKSIADVTGGGKVPTIAELAGPRYRGQKRENTSSRKNDPKLTSLLRAVINKQASQGDVAKAAAEVDKYIEKNEAAKKELARIATTVVNSGKLTNYGTEAAQKKLVEWNKKYGSEPSTKKDE